MFEYVVKQLRESSSIQNPDDPNNIYILRQTIQRKTFLKKTYIDFYQDILQRITDAPSDGLFVELGSGAGFLKSMAPHITTSDILPYEGIDKVFSALDMPFEDSSIAAFVMIDVLHHIKDSRLFFQELQRCLKPNGKVVMIEPSNTLWSNFIYRNFHHEPFDAAGGWGFEEGGPLSGANTAIPWIIFKRDRQIFDRDFPAFQVCSVKMHTPFKYLISGGLSMRQLLPSWAYGLVDGFETLLSPFNALIGMFMTIELKKLY